MRIRTVISGISAAVLCSLMLWFQYYRIETSKFVPGWPVASPHGLLADWMPVVILSFCGLTLFAFGWVAARWNWAGTWQSSMAFGAGMGLLSGCLIYNYIGVYWFSIQGYAEILGNFYNPMTEAEGVKMLVEALIETEITLYTNFIWCVLACVTLGALGGLVSAVDLKDRWGPHPRNPEGWLFRLPAYILVFFGILNLVVNIAVMELFADKLLNTVAQMKELYGVELEHVFNKSDILSFNYLVGWLFAILPAGFIVGWFIRLYRRGGRLNLLSITGLVIMFVFILLTIWFMAPSMLSSQVISSALLISLAVAIVPAAWVGLMSRDDSEGFPYRSSDWIGYLLGYGILGGTQIVMGALVFSLPATLLGIVNIPHLVNSGIVDKSPVSQVIYLFGIQTGAALASIIVSVVMALIIVNVVSFVRSLLDIRETYHPHKNP